MPKQKIFGSGKPGTCWCQDGFDSFNALLHDATPLG